MGTPAGRPGPDLADPDLADPDCTQNREESVTGSDLGLCVRVEKPAEISEIGLQ